MFSVGDTVVYGSQGVCRIEGTQSKKIRGEYVDYIVLKPVYDQNSTVFVPKNNEELLAKMREILSADEIYRIISELPERDPIWIDDDNIRKAKYQEMIDEGDRRKIMLIIKTLYRHKLEQEEKGRRLHQADEFILRQAEKLLHDEFALVLDIRPDEVVPFIMEQIDVHKKVRNKSQAHVPENSGACAFCHSFGISLTV